MRLSRRQLRKLILKEMEDPTLPPQPVIPVGEMLRDDMPSNDMPGGDEDSEQFGRPDEKLIKAIFFHMDNFLKDFVPSFTRYGGQFGRLNMGHIKQLQALTRKLQGCASGEVQEPWVMCAEPVKNLLVLISQMVKTGKIDRYVNAPANRGGLIALLQLSIGQAKERSKS